MGHLFISHFCPGFPTSRHRVGHKIKLIQNSDISTAKATEQPMKFVDEKIPKEPLPIFWWNSCIVWRSRPGAAIDCTGRQIIIDVHYLNQKPGVIVPSCRPCRIEGGGPTEPWIQMGVHSTWSGPGWFRQPANWWQFVEDGSIEDCQNYEQRDVTSEGTDVMSL